VNRRDYAGSTKYTDDDLKDLNEGNASFMERLGTEVAHLLIWFADTHKVPKVSADRKTGGFSVMGWSMGNATPMALLAYPEFVGREAYAKLEPYFRQLILYDPPFLAMGHDQPPEGYNPFTDPEFPTQEAIFMNFGLWVCGYYNHPDLASRSVRGLNFDKRGELPNPDDPKSTGRPFSINNMTEDEMKANFDDTAASRTEFPMFFPMQPTLYVQGQKALFDEKLAREVLPRTEVVHIWCARAQWYCVYGMIETERQYKKHVKQEHRVRPIRFIEMEDANHFVHWDEPEKFWAATVEAIKR